MCNHLFCISSSQYPIRYDFIGPVPIDPKRKRIKTILAPAQPEPTQVLAIRFLQLHPEGCKIRDRGRPAPAGQRQGTRMGSARGQRKRGREVKGRYLGRRMRRRKESRAGGGVRRRDGAGAGARRWSGGRVCQLILLLRPYRKGKGNKRTGGWRE